MEKSIDIKSGKYVGYYWMSDAQKPEVIDEAKQMANVELVQGQSFIIEAQLYSEEQGISYSIKFVDGKHIVIVTEVTEDDLQNITKYVPNRMPGIAAIRFTQRWVERPDENCMGMNVLQPAEFVFVGFEK